MPAPKKKVDPMAAKVRKMESWQDKHQKECLRVYEQIRVATSVLPAMKVQLDAQDATLSKQNEILANQDKLLDVIRNSQGAVRITGKVGAIGIALFSVVQGLVALGQWLLSHWQ